MPLGDPGMSRTGNFSIDSGAANPNQWVHWSPPQTTPPQRCQKHRLANLQLVGEEVHGQCVGCGEVAVVPMLPETGRALLRVMALFDRVTALSDLPDEDRKRVLHSSDLMGDYQHLQAVAVGNRADLDQAKRALGLIGARLAELVGTIE